MVTLYEHLVQRIHTDGRNIDIAIEELIGEATDQKSSGTLDQHIQSVAETWEQGPRVDRMDPTYYDRPMLKEPVWELTFTTYYYTGVLAGASLALAAAAQIGNSKDRESLIMRCHLIGIIGSSLSGGLLVYNLGVLSRFINVLRVFRDTSPMNMGAWIFFIAGATSTGTVLLRNRRGRLAKLINILRFVSGLAGLALAAYTGVLVANSAVPLWRASRESLPVLFGASAISSVGFVLDLLIENPAERHINSVFGTAGSLLMRFTVQHAGVLSARDARASFYQQRAGRGAAEVTTSHHS